MWPFKKKEVVKEIELVEVARPIEKLTHQDIYDLIRKGSAGKGWLGFASDVQDALIAKNGSSYVQT